MTCKPESHQMKKTEENQVVTMQCEVCGRGTRLDLKTEAPMEYCGPETNGQWKPIEEYDKVHP